MKANYHTHTWRCSHATGTEEGYVKAAIQAGMEILGFSDHTPYLFPEGHYSYFRMRPEQLPDYTETVRDLKRRYAGRIEIHLGVECEFYPKHFEDTLAFLRDNQVEYLILGQHFIGNEYDSLYSGRITTCEEDLVAYCRQSMEAMNTGLFTYFAHPDLHHFLGNPRFYKAQARALCREANSCGMPLELNLLGIREDKWYPNPYFWEVVGEENCNVILGCDAHEEGALDHPKAMEEAMKLVKAFGLKVVDTVDLRSIL